eukprot:437615-Prorocentrum_minimum.AAC.1
MHSTPQTLDLLSVNPRKCVYRFGFATNTGLDALMDAAAAKYHRLLLEETYREVEAAVRRDDLSRVWQTGETRRLDPHTSRPPSIGGPAHTQAAKTRTHTGRLDPHARAPRPGHPRASDLDV